MFNGEIAWRHLSYFVFTQVVSQNNLRLSTAPTEILEGVGIHLEEIQDIETRFVTLQQSETFCPGGHPPELIQHEIRLLEHKHDYRAVYLETLAIRWEV